MIYLIVSLNSVNKLTVLIIRLGVSNVVNDRRC